MPRNRRSLGHCREGLQERAGRAVADAFIGERKKSLAPAVVKPRDHQRPAHVEAELVPAQHRFRCRRAARSRGESRPGSRCGSSRRRGRATGWRRHRRRPAWTDCRPKPQVPGLGLELLDRFLEFGLRRQRVGRNNSTQIRPHHRLDTSRRMFRGPTSSTIVVRRHMKNRGDDFALCTTCRPF